MHDHVPLDAGTAPVPIGQAPLILDVDNALLLTDLLHETAMAHVRANPLRVFQVAYWLWQGKAVLKRRLGERVPLEVENLPANEDLVKFSADAHARGREIGIATAADELLAQRLVRRFDFIEFAIASDGVTNLKGETKAQALTERFPDGFAYAGDSRSDLAVWKEASSIILVGASPKIANQAHALGKPIEAEFSHPRLGLSGWLKALRVHQWAKNALVFVPLVLSGMASQPLEVLHALAAFVAMSLMASGTYLINDLFDLADDRKHWSKRNRPLASGRMRIARAIPASAALILASFVVAAWLGWPSFVILFVYMALTLAYSTYLKRQPIVDAFTLAVLFTLRLGIGITAVSAVPSPWLLVFSMFLFTSLSFAKRQTEIQRSTAKGQSEISGRGYVGTDSAFVFSMGIATGMAAIIIMVLYIMNDVYSAVFYSQPLLLWTFPAILFMWISRIWLLCHREQLNDDPVAFAIRDKVSIALGGVMALSFLAGWLL